MNRFYVVTFLTTLLISLGLNSQTLYNTYQNEMDVAYQLYPNVPEGMLEAWANTTTHFSHKDDSSPEGCSGIPKVFTVFGLTENGKGYFRENLLEVSRLSGYSVSSIKSNPQTGILAFAAAYSQLLIDQGITSSDPKDHITVIHALTEFPLDHNPVNDFAMNAHIYQLFSFMNESTNQVAYQFPSYNIDMVQLFGSDNYEVLSSSNITAASSSVSNQNGTQFNAAQLRSPDYPAGIWNPAPTCNYSSRNGTAISALTVHTIQGSYAGAISWSQNCSSNVSYHYVVRSSDGQVTQMVLEADKGWHVGSANPYAIGIEHEGWVNDASWYTTAMYNSSSDIARDVVSSGYGMLGIRTYYGAATSGLNTLGACTQFKGHQHFPNQTHTDPGINWDWKRYYNLINPFPSVVPITASTGTFYDSGGAAGNYTDDERDFTLIQPTGASSVTLNFNQFDLETNWDYLLIYDGDNPSAPLIGQYTGNANPGTITSSTGSILIEFRSDCATTNPGWEISWSSNGNGGSTDVTAPLTNVAVSGTWQTQDFNATFSDADETGGSGLQNALYQVIDFDGADWRANNALGFYSDNFDNALHPDWTSSTGIWSISNGVLDQGDQTLTNTNIYSPLDQNNANEWFFHYSMKIDGTGTNRRAGFHFMSDDGSQSERGNSYFVWFRTDNGKIQIYKTTNNVFALEQDIPYTINNGQWYDVKILYSKTTGKIEVWLNNALAADWTDPSPYTVGNDISFRSGDANYQVNNFKAYHERSTSELITVGATEMIRYQNQDPNTFSGKVKSITIDSARNISSIEASDINVDWTIPSNVANLFDGDTIGPDQSTQPYTTKILAHWDPATDTHSDIARYWYAIGSTPGATDIVNWTDNWFNTSFTHPGLSLTQGATYYVSVQAENGAGLIGNPLTSNGVTVDPPAGTPDAEFVVYNTTVCLGEAISITNSSSNATSYSWTTSGGTLSSATALNPDVYFTSSGTYTITLTATGPGGTDVSSQTLNVIVNSPAVANATLSASQVAPGNSVSFTNLSSNANGYFWDFGDGNSSTSSDPIYTYSNLGTYQVMLIAVNGICDNDTAYFTVDVVDNVSVYEEDEHSFNVLPNPNNGQFNIELVSLNNEPVSIKLFAVNGQLIKDLGGIDVNEGDNLIPINIDGVAKGVYHLTIIQNEVRRTVKIILE